MTTELQLLLFQTHSLIWSVCICRNRIVFEAQAKAEAIKVSITQHCVICGWALALFVSWPDALCVLYESHSRKCEI